MFAILRSESDTQILVKVDTADDVQNQLSDWYDSARRELGEEEAVQFVESLIVVTLQ